MPNIFLVSDTHFGHANILNFTRSDGSPVRSFKDVNHMNETMIERWNSVVRPQDKVYHLGDVAMNPKHIPLIARCNGHKRLILGNHDPKDMGLLMPYFEAIYSSRYLEGIVMTHIPVSDLSFRKALVNVHGHVHNDLNNYKYGYRYFNVCVEVIDYTPISLDTVRKKCGI